MPPIEFDAFAWGIIHRKARRMIGRAGLTRADREDLVQELACRLWQSAAHFNPQRAHWKSFVTTIIERNVRKILRDRSTAKRTAHRLESLDPDEEAIAARMATPSAEIAFDVTAVLQRLPSELRPLAQRLMTHSLSEIARDWQVPRSTLQRHVRALRLHFLEAGFEEFSGSLR